MGGAVFIGAMFLIALIVWGSIKCCCPRDPDLENRVLPDKTKSRTVFKGKPQATVTELESKKFKNKNKIQNLIEMDKSNTRAFQLNSDPTDTDNSHLAASDLSVIIKAGLKTEKFEKKKFGLW